MDEWTPEPEQPVTDEWLAAEHERLREQEDTWRASDVAGNDVTAGPNRAGRSPAGRFTKMPDPEREFRTDGDVQLGPDEYQEALLKIRALTRWPRVVSPFAAMEVVVVMRRLCDELEFEAVAFARGHHWSWRAVGDALAMTESGAYRRFAGALRARERRPRGS